MKIIIINAEKLQMIQTEKKDPPYYRPPYSIPADPPDEYEEETDTRVTFEIYDTHVQLTFEDDVSESKINIDTDELKRLLSLL